MRGWYIGEVGWEKLQYFFSKVQQTWITVESEWMWFVNSCKPRWYPPPYFESDHNFNCDKKWRICIHVNCSSSLAESHQFRLLGSRNTSFCTMQQKGHVCKDVLHESVNMFIMCVYQSMPPDPPYLTSPMMSLCFHFALK